MATDLWDKVLALVNVLKSKSIVPDELDVIIVSNTTCPVISYSIHNCYTNILYGTEQVLVSYQIPKTDQCSFP